MLTYLLLTSGILDAMGGNGVTAIFGAYVLIPGAIMADMWTIGTILWHFGGKQKVQRQTDELDAYLEDKIGPEPDVPQTADEWRAFMKRDKRRQELTAEWRKRH